MKRFTAPGSWDKVTASLLLAFFLILSFAGSSSYAQVPGDSKAKAAMRLQETMAAGSPRDLIVIIDDKAIEAEAQALSAEAGSPSRVSRMLERKVTRYAEGKQRALSGFASHEAAVLKNYSHLPASFVRVHSKEALDRLLARPDVVGVFENPIERISLAESLPLIGQSQAATQGNLGAGTTVAVLDTGVDYRKAAFGSCSSPGVPANCKVVYAQDFAPSDGQPDNDGHGTNVAGIVLGVAPGAKIAALDVFSGSPASGDLLAYGSDILNAINWVIANKATYNIVAMNLSIGSGRAASPVTGGAYNAAVNQARAAGILTIAAAGNDGYTNAMSEIAATTGVISVGAVYDASTGPMFWGSPLRCQDSVTAVDKVACFSNSTSFLTMLAPGAMITAAGISQGGTSQAAPHVAGAVAVLRAAFPSETLDQTIARLTNGVTVTDRRNDLAKPRLSLPLAIGVTSTCSYSISESGRTFSANGSTGSVTVTTAAGCSWTAASSGSTWITLTSGGSGTGSGSVSYSVAENGNTSSRTGSMTIAGQTYTIIQSGSTGTVVNILRNPGFESGPVVWTDSTINGLPIISAFQSPVNNNNWYAWLCGYNNCVDSLYQDITIPVDAQIASVQFSYWIKTNEVSSSSAFDSLSIRVYSPPSASTYSSWTLSNLNAASGWNLSQKYDVSAFRGQTIRLQFTGTTDSELPTDFFVDDVTLTVTGAAPDTQPPSVPAALTATTVSASTVNLAWTAASDNIAVTGYKVYRGGTLLATLGNLRVYSDTGLVAGTSYSYTVSACDAAGNCSPQSSAAVALTAVVIADVQSPTVPGAPSATAVSTNTINLAWLASSDNVGVTNYKVYRAASSSLRPTKR